jgi:hypothetical protein
MIIIVIIIVIRIQVRSPAGGGGEWPRPLARAAQSDKCVQQSWRALQIAVRWRDCAGARPPARAIAGALCNVTPERRSL